MTVAEWLATREPAAPEALLEGVKEALGTAGAEDARYVTERCVDAAERVVAGLLRDGRTGRESAPDLLAADALVTYAFEAAADDPVRLADRARDAMSRLARLGTVRVPDRSPGGPGANRSGQ